MSRVVVFLFYQSDRNENDTGDDREWGNEREEPCVILTNKEE